MIGKFFWKYHCSAHRLGYLHQNFHLDNKNDIEILIFLRKWTIFGRIYFGMLLFLFNNILVFLWKLIQHFLIDFKGFIRNFYNSCICFCIFFIFNFVKVQYIHSLNCKWMTNAFKYICLHNLFNNTIFLCCCFIFLILINFVCNFKVFAYWQ